MSTESTQYMLIFRGTEWCKGLSPEQMQKVAADMMAWFTRLKEQGKVTAGAPLEPEGKVLSGKGGRTIADGPFAESKEAIGGYFLINAGSLDEAVTMAKECPGLSFGAQVEVRPVASECPMARAAEQQLAHAH